LAGLTRLKAALCAHRPDPELQVEEVRAQMAAEAGALLSVEGIDVELEIWPDVVHVWHLLAPRFAQANKAIDQLADWLGETGRMH
jgi:acetyl esterase/lipase